MFKNKIKFYKVPQKNISKFVLVNIDTEMNLLEIKYNEGNRFPLQLWTAEEYDFNRISEQDGMKLYAELYKILTKYFSGHETLKNIEDYFECLNEFMLVINKYNLKEMRVEIQYRSYSNMYGLYYKSPKKYTAMKELMDAINA